MSNILFICNKPPYQDSAAREALEAAMTTAIFGHETALLLTGDAVLQLLTPQQPAQLELKNQGASMQALSLYDIEKLYVNEADLQRLQLDAASLSPQPLSLTATELQALIQQQQQVITL